MPYKPNTLRIIGGHWRGRKLNFPNISAIRPTPDRVRETLFNWLAPVIHEANCLDLFAGSGALSFEALSRGAKQVTLIDQNPDILAYLRKQIVSLQAESQATLYQASLPQNFPHLIGPFDIVFLDPPFHKDLLLPCCTWLIEQQLLAKDALIYIEAESTLKILPIPEHWQLLRSKQAGEVGYHLVQVSA